MFYYEVQNCPFLCLQFCHTEQLTIPERDFVFVNLQQWVIKVYLNSRKAKSIFRSIILFQKPKRQNQLWVGSKGWRKGLSRQLREEYSCFLCGCSGMIQYQLRVSWDFKGFSNQEDHTILKGGLMKFLHTDLVLHSLIK